jgi:hypothetical protein
MRRGAVVVCEWTDSSTSDWPGVFGSFVTARMGVSVGRFPQEVLLEESYRSESSETVRVGRVHAFQELLTVIDSCVRELVEVIRVRILEELWTLIKSCVLNAECSKLPLWKRTSKFLTIHPKILKKCTKKFPKIIKICPTYFENVPKIFWKMYKILKIWNIANIMTY